MLCPPGYAIGALRIDPSEAVRTAQKALKRATVTSYASSAKLPTVTPGCTGEAWYAPVASPIVKVPPVTSTRPQPATVGVQLRWPLLHAPLTHDWPAAHGLPHAPQWLVFVARLTHAPTQRLVPLGHDDPHAPATHVAEPPVGAGHAVHDEPHDVTEVSETQLLPQRCVPLPQTQLPIALHTPLNGDEHAPEVRAETEHTTLPALHASIPDWAQPPLPLDMQAPPRAWQLLPHTLVPGGQTVPQTPAEQL